MADRVQNTMHYNISTCPVSPHKCYRPVYNDAAYLSNKMQERYFWISWFCFIQPLKWFDFETISITIIGSLVRKKINRWKRWFRRRGEKRIALTPLIMFPVVSMTKNNWVRVSHSRISSTACSNTELGDSKFASISLNSNCAVMSLILRSGLQEKIKHG